MIGPKWLMSTNLSGGRATRFAIQRGSINRPDTVVGLRTCFMVFQTLVNLSVDHHSSTLDLEGGAPSSSTIEFDAQSSDDILNYDLDVGFMEFVRIPYEIANLK